MYTTHTGHMNKQETHAYEAFLLVCEWTDGKFATPEQTVFQKKKHITRLQHQGSVPSATNLVTAIDTLCISISLELKTLTSA